MSAIAAHQAGGDHSAAFQSERTHVSVRRYLAHFVDGLLYGVAVFAFVFAAVYIGESIGGAAGDALYIGSVAIALTIGHAWFLVVLHGKSGRSPGKRLAGIRVVDAQGNAPTRSQMWKRSIPAIVEYFYIIAFASMMSSDYRQRFGDRWADTYVVAD